MPAYAAQRDKLQENVDIHTVCIIFQSVFITLRFTFIFLRKLRETRHRISRVPEEKITKTVKKTKNKY